MKCKKCKVELDLPDHMWEDDYWIYCPECGKKHKNPYKGIIVERYTKIKL